MEIDKTKQLISDSAARLFFQQGFSKTTVDEIAESLGISKKTLYECFPGKDAIIEYTIDRFTQATGEVIDKILFDRELDTFRKLSALFKIVGERLSAINPILMKDLLSKYPHIWEKIDNFRQQKVLANFRIIFEQGIKEGVFRQDIEVDLLLQIYVDMVRSAINPQRLSRSAYSPRQIFEAMMKIVFQGILTEKGRGEAKIEFSQTFSESHNE